MAKKRPNIRKNKYVAKASNESQSEFVIEGENFMKIRN
jgi:hypothetical protein